MKTFLPSLVPNITVSKQAKVFLLSLLIMMLGALSSFAATITSTTTGGIWATGSTWVGGVAPLATDAVVIATTGGNSVTIDAATTCAGLTINSGAILNVGGFALTVNTNPTVISGTINFTSATGIKTFNSAVTLNSGAVWNESAAAPITFANNFTNNASTFTASTGVHTFTNNFSIGGTTANVIPSVSISNTRINNGILTISTTLAGGGTLVQGTNTVLNYGGTAVIGPGLTASATGNTVNYYGAGNQTIKLTTYYNLNLSGGGTKTALNNFTATNITVNSGSTFASTSSGTTTVTNFTVNSGGTANLARDIKVLGSMNIAGTANFNRTLTVSGATTISGTVTFADAGRAKSFYGLVTINAGAVWTENAASSFIFWGGISNSGTFTANTGVHEFNTFAQSITGTISIPNVKINGITLTNNGNFTISTELTEGGTSAIIQGANSTLTFGGAYALDNLTASATGNTVHYSGGAQTVKSPVATNYYNLTLSGSGAKSITTANVTVNGTLSMEGTATASAAPTYGSMATLQYNTATGRNTGAEWITPFVATGGIKIANAGLITTIGAKVLNCGVPLTIAPSIAKLTLGAALSVGGNFTNAGTFSTSASNYALTLGGNLSNTGTLTLGSSAITIGVTGCAVDQSIAGFTTTGTVTMAKTSNTATFTGNVGTGALTINGSGGTLNLGAGLSHTFTNVTLTAGILNGGSSTMNVSGTWTGTGSNFVPNQSTVVFNGTSQTISASSTTFNNVTFSGTGNKTFSSSFTVNTVMTINSGSVIQLADGTTSTTFILYYGTTLQTNGSYGSTASSATNKHATQFGTTSTGILNVSATTRLVITGSTTQTTGNCQTITITATQPGTTNTETTYIGTQTLTFSGATASPNYTSPTVNGTAFGSPVSLTFTNGVATATLCLYKVEAASIGAIEENGYKSRLSTDYLNVNVTANYGLVFTTQPGGGSTDEIWAIQPVVTVVDAYGNIDLAAQNITVAIGTNPSAGALSGTKTVALNTSTGTATFTDLSISNAGAGYTLQATTSKGSATGTSAAFNISNLVPVLNSISPGFTCANASPVTVEVFGSNFNTQSLIQVNGVSRTNTYVSPTELTFELTAQENSASNTFTITVFNPTPGGGTSSSVSLFVSLVEYKPSVTQPTCYALGKITLGDISGGTAPYTYDWADIDGTSNVKDRVGLAPGTYTVIVTDANGCSTEYTSPDLIEEMDCPGMHVCQSDAASVISTDPDPENTSYTWTIESYTDPVVDYTIAITSGQGTPSITVNWTGVPVGTYKVCVTGHNVCGTSSQTCRDVYVEVPNINAYADQLCSGGTLVLTAFGGVAYGWKNPDGIVFSHEQFPVIYNATPANNGTYTVTVTDENGCTATTTVVVTVYDIPTAIAGTVTNTTACGESNGAINLTSPVGDGYTYLWSNGATTEDLTEISSGTYTVIVTNSLGCSAEKTFVVNDNGGPTLTYSQVNVSCYDGNNGSINLTVSGGGGSPYTYDWSNGETTEDISGLTAGIYNVIVTSNTGCTSALTITITQPLSPIQANGVVTNINCFGGSTGSIVQTVSGGTPTYSYSWKKNSVAYGGNTKDLSTLAFGTYEVTITDSKGCIYTKTYIVTQPAAALSALTSKTDISCFGGTNGTVNLTVSGGTSPYTFAWTKTGVPGFSASTEDLVNVSAGTYNVTVTDAKGCTTTASATVGQPAVLDVTADVVGVSCFDGSTGSLVTLEVTGGTTPYTYLWSNGATTQDLSNVPAGTYSVTVTDARGCTAIESAVVGQPTQLIASISGSTNVSCNGGADGIATAAGSGGTPGYTYLWNTNPQQTGATATGLAPGTYIVTVTDANLCSAQALVTITQPAAINVTGFPTNVSCDNGNNGAINLVVSGGTPSYTYDWADIGTPGIFTDTEDRTGLSAGTYTVIVKDANGCQVTKNYTITQPAALTANAVASNATCNGAKNGSINLTVDGGTMPYTYVWSNAAATEDISSLAPGTYTVTVTDALGCIATTSATVTEPAVLTLAGVVTDNCPSQSNGQITLSASGGTGTYQYKLDAGTYQTSNIFNGLAAGTYTATVKDANNCEATATFTLAPMSVELIPYEVSCNYFINTGVYDGEIYTSISNGTEPFIYAWTGSGNAAGFTSSAPNISGLTWGTYQVVITDANGCSVTVSTTLVQPTCNPPLAVNDFFTTCGTPVIGSVATNDSDPDNVPLVTQELEFLPLDGPSTEQGTIVWDALYNGAFTFTPATNYTGTVTIRYHVEDPIGLSAEGLLTIYVSQQTATISAANTTHVNCGATNGSATVTHTGGIAPYAILWNDPLAQTTAAASNLAAGTYTVTITDSNPLSPCSVTATVTIENVCLTITKTLKSVNGDIAATKYNAPDDVIAYDIVVTNTGTDTLENIVVADALPGVLVTGSPIAMLAPSASATVTASYKVVAADLAAGEVVNTASAAFTFNDKEYEYSDSETVEAGNADLVTVKSLNSSDDTPNEGDVVSFKITVTNLGPASANSVSLSDVLPSGLTLISGIPNKGNYNTTTGLWDGFSLANNASAELIITASVNFGQSGSIITNTTTKAVSTNPDPTDVGNDLEESVVVNVNLSVGDASVTEGGNLSFAISLDNPSSTEVSFTPSFTNITTTNNDYTQSPIQYTFNGVDYFTWESGNITIPAGVTSVTFVVPTTDDMLAEPGEAFTLTATVTSGNTSNPSASGTGIIEDNDAVTIAINDVTVAEEDGFATFTVTLTGSIQDALSFNFTTVNGTALAGFDYTSTSGTLTFPAGSVSGATLSITVPVLDDMYGEPTESFYVDLSYLMSNSNASFSDAQGIGTITDTYPMIAVGDASVTEGGNLSFAISLDNPSSTEVSFTPSFTNITTTNNDYTQSPIQYTFNGVDYFTWESGNITIPAGVTSVTFVVPTTDDMLAEPGEAFTLTATVTSGNTSNPSASGTGIIEDNDAVTIAINDVTVAEEDGTATFTVTLTGNIQDALSFDFTTANNTALAGSDYTTTAGTLTFPAGSVSGATLTITVPIINDNIGEPTEEYYVNLSDIVFNGSATFSDAQGVGTITDTYPMIAVGDASVTEGGNLAFAITLDNPSSTPVTFTPSFTNVSTTNADYTQTPIQYTFNGVDFFEWTSGNITIPAGTTSLTFVVPTTNDMLAENTETFTLTATVNSGNTSNTSDSGTGEILDNDAVTIAINDVTVAEETPGFATFTVTLTGAIQDALSFNYATADGTALDGFDYTLTSGTLTFPAGSVNGATLTITVPVLDDNIGEPTESYYVNLSNIVFNGSATFSDAQGVGTITDTYPMIAVGDASVTEGGNLAFAITLDNPSSTPVTFTPSFTNVSTTNADYTQTPIQYTFNGVDFFEWTGGDITIPVGATSVTFVVPTTNDMLAENTETFTLTATITSGNTSNTSDSGTGEILDNDAVTIAINDVTVAEETPGFATFTVTLTGAIQDALTVDYTTAPNSALAGSDYTTTSGTLTFPAGSVSGATLTITVPVLDDNIGEPTESYYVNLSNIVFNGSATFSDAQGVGTITDTYPMIAVGDASVTEGGNLAFAITLDNPSSTPVTFTPSFTNGTTTNDDYTQTPIQYTFNGTDYFTWESGDITIPAGTTSVSFVVPTTNDNIAEPTETFTLTATVNSGNTSNASDSGTGEILDNDAVTIAINDVTVAEEDGTATFTVTLTGNIQDALSFDFTTANNTALAGSDYTTTAGTLTFPAGSVSGATLTITVPIINDNIGEPTEQYYVNLSDIVFNGSATFSDAQGVGTITDIYPAIAVGDASVTEGGNLAFAITLDNPSSTPVLFTPSFTNGTTTNDDYTQTPIQYTFNGTDYFTWESGNITIPAGTTSLTFVVPTTNDNMAEPTETFTLTATVNSGNTSNASDSGTGEILDNDAVTIAINDVTVAEEDGTATFTVTLTGNIQDALSFDFTTANNTALAGSDYTTTAGTLTFPAGSVSGATLTITVPIINDYIGEPTEQYYVNLSDIVFNGSATFSDAQGVGTITDIYPAIAVGDASVTEGGNLAFAITLDNPSSTPVLFTPSFTNGTTTNDDYTQTPIQYTFNGTDYFTWESGNITIPVGVTSLTFVVPTTNDNIAEPTETFTLTATVTSGNTANTSDSSTGEILDNDAVTIAIDDVTVAEETPGYATFTVTLTGNIQDALSYAYTTADGTALAGSDYTLTSGTLTFPAGSVSGATLTITVPVLDDMIGEPTENYFVNLSAIVFNGSATFSDAQGMGTITDTYPMLAVGNASVTEGGNLTFAITLDNPSSTPVTFTPSFTNVSTTNDDYTQSPIQYTFNGTDYFAWISGDITIPAGTTSVLFVVPTTEDMIDENDEIFTLAATVTSGNTSNASATGTGTILDDDTIISGTVFNDENRLTDGKVNGTGTNAGGLYVNLTNPSTNLVIASVQVNTDGTYSFNSTDHGVLESTIYNVILTVAMQAEGASLTTAVLPMGWISTGEHVGVGPGDDGVANSILTVATTTTGVTEANFGIVKVPDVTPVITAVPNVMHGITDFNITVRVTELNQVDTKGTITVKIPKDYRWVFSVPYNQGSTQVGLITVNNNQWNYSQDTDYHIFTNVEGMVIPAGSYSIFGFSATFDPASTKGLYTITSQIISGSGGEDRIDNNVDAEKLDYFIY